MHAGVIATFEVALGLSLTYSLIPGGSTIEALRRGAARGPVAAVSLRVGSLAGGLLWAAMAFSGAGAVLRSPRAHELLSVAASAVLLLLVWRTLPRVQGVRGGVSTASRRGDVLAGLLLGIANPLAAAFWLSVAGTLLGSASATGRSADVAAFVAGFVVVHVLCTAVMAGVVGGGRRVGGGWRASGQITRAANLLAVVPLAWFALTPLIRAL